MVSVSRRACAVLIALTLAVAAGACSSDDTGGSASTTTEADGSGSTTTPSTPGGGAPGAAARPLLDVTALGTTTGTDGRVYLADGQGRALQLRGANIKTQDPEADASEQALDDLAERGFNLLRLSVYWHQLEPEQGTYDEAYLDDVATVLDRAEARGITVIVSFHQDVFGPAFGDAGIPEWATRSDGIPFEQQDMWMLNYLEPALQAAFQHLYEDDDLRQAQAAMVAHVAERFGDHPAVIGYDLLNEPWGQIQEGEDLAAAAKRLQSVQLTAMYDRLSAAIRAVDEDGWIFIEPPNVASVGLPVDLGPVDDDRVVFFPHFYDPDVESANYLGGEATLDLAFFEQYEPIIVTYAQEHGVPLMIGEWGLGNPDREQMDVFVEESLQLMDRIGSGWTMFTWCRGESYCPIDAEGTDRPNIGRIVRPWARAIGGAPTSFTFDPETSQLKVVFDDLDEVEGTTDLALTSATTYPDGFEVVTSDAEGEWSMTHDEDADTVAVTTPRTGGTHAICLQPEGSALPCIA